MTTYLEGRSVAAGITWGRGRGEGEALAEEEAEEEEDEEFSESII